MPRALKVVLWIVAVLVGIIAALVLLVALMDWNWVKPTVNRQLSDLAHRPVQIDGDLKVGWTRCDDCSGWQRFVPWPRIQAEDVFIGNPSWAATGDQMLRTQALDFRLDPLALRRHELHLPDVVITSGHLVLERREDGTNNWTFRDENQSAADDRTDNKGWEINVERLLLDDATVRVVDAVNELDATAVVNTAADADASGYSTTWNLEGVYHGAKVTGEGHLGQVLQLREGDEPFPVQGRLDVAGTTIAAEGTVTRPQALAGLDLDFELAGPTMADLYPLLGIALPNTPPYKTRGRLLAKLGEQEKIWDYKNFTGSVGKSDIEGSLTYTVREPRPLLTGALESKLLRLKDLGPLVGADTADDVAVPDADIGKDSEKGEKPKPENDEDTKTPNDGATKPAKEGVEQAESDARSDDGEAAGGKGKEDGLTKHEEPPADKALPVDQADTRIWETMDADVTFKGKRIVSNADLPLDDVQAHVVLEDAILKLQPLDFGVAGGTLKSTITLNGKSDVIDAALKAEARGLQLSQLFPGVESMDAALGSVHGDADLTGRGNSVSALMDHASGDLRAVVSKGTVSHFLLEAAGLNVANMVLVKLFGDEQVMLQCLVADFSIDDGLMQTQAFVLETDDAVVTVDGQINLASEDLHLDVHPENKSLRIFTLRSPLYVRGTFKDPDVGVEKGPIAARAGAAVALGVVATPLAALLPLLNVGTDDTTHCTISQGGDAPSGKSKPGHVTGSVPGAEPFDEVEP